MKLITIALCLILLPLNNETITTEHLKVFEGEWTGTLSYLNYADDKKMVDLTLKMEATFDGKSLKFDYFYNEGNGRIEKRNGNFKLKGDQVIFNGKWKKEKAYIQGLDQWQLFLSSEGKDNNRPALFKKHVEVSPNEIVVTKMVKYLDADGDYFLRNKHVFKR